MARRPPSRAGRRTRSHHHLRRPRRRHRGAAALHGRRGCGPDRHQRRPGTDRRRHDRRHRRPVLRPRAGVGCRAGEQDRRHPQEADGPHRFRRFRGDAGRQPQTGHGPGRSGGDGSGRNRPRRGHSRQADRRRAARSAARTATDVEDRGADTRRAGRHRRPNYLPPRHHQNVRAAGVRSGRDPARGRRRVYPNSPRWRSPPACAAARSKWSPATNPTPPTPTVN